jgi:hypothetical protein
MVVHLAALLQRVCLVKLDRAVTSSPVGRKPLFCGWISPNLFYPRDFRRWNPYLAAYFDDEKFASRYLPSNRYR